MLWFDALAAKPAAYFSLTGLNPAELHSFRADFSPRYDAHRVAATITRRDRTPRRSAPGAVGCYARDLSHRLLMALVWFKVYPAYELLGLHLRNAQLNVRAALEVLEKFDDFPFDRLDGRRPKLGSVGQSRDAFPEVRLVIDSKEQRDFRTSGWHEHPKPFNLGKKKAYTLKTHVAINPMGLTKSVTPGKFESIKDVRLLRENGLLVRLEAGEAAMTDKGYEGAE